MWTEPACFRGVADYRRPEAMLHASVNQNAMKRARKVNGAAKPQPGESEEITDGADHRKPSFFFFFSFLASVAFAVATSTGLVSLGLAPESTNPAFISM